MTDLAPAPIRRVNPIPIYKAVGWTPHAGQIKVLGSRARHKVVACGRRWGKSNYGGHRLTPEAIRAEVMKMELRRQSQRHEYWIVGPEYSDAEKEFRVLWNDLSLLEVPFDKPGSYNNPESGQMTVSLWGGRYIVRAMSAKYPATLVGEALSGVIMAEAAKMKPSVWLKYIRPTLADFKGWSLHTSTPEGKNHFYEQYNRGQDEDDEEWASWRMPSWTNPHVFPEGATEESLILLRRMMNPESPADREITARMVLAAGMDREVLDLARDMSSEKFDQEIGASFTDFVGRVFKEFDEEYHVTNVKYRPDLPVYLAVDYGWTNPFVALAIQVDVHGTIYVVGEYRAINKDINDIAEDLANDPIASRCHTLYPDPAAPGDTAVLAKKLKCRVVSNTGGEIKHRLELIRQQLKLTTGLTVNDIEARLYIDRSCKGLIYEMNEYRWPDNKTEQKSNPEKPMDKDDHGPEALGRFFKGWFGGIVPRARARQSTARVG